MEPDVLHLFRPMITTRRSTLKLYSKLSAIRSSILGIFAMEAWSSKQAALSQGEICWSEENINEGVSVEAIGPGVTRVNRHASDIDEKHQ
jgi:hypothetical protein